MRGIESHPRSKRSRNGYWRCGPKTAESVFVRREREILHRRGRGTEFVELGDSGGSTTGGAWVYRLAPTKVIAFGGAHGQTTYRF